MSLTIEYGELGQLGVQLGRGGQAVVFEVPGLRLPDAPGPLVYKEYKRQPPSTAELRRIVDVRAKLSIVDRSWLDERSTWPLRVVLDGGTARGILMRRIPVRFGDNVPDMITGAPSWVLREVQLLFIDPARLGGRLLARQVPTWEQRLAVCREFAGLLDFYHERLRVVFGDINPKNELYRLDGSPAVMFIDCEGVRPLGQVTSHGQLNAPDWFPPKGETSSVTTDRYKLGLFVRRALLPGAAASIATDPAPIASVLDVEGVDLLTRAIGSDADPYRRPTAYKWWRYFSRVLGIPVEGHPVELRWTAPDAAEVKVVAAGFPTTVDARPGSGVVPIHLNRAGLNDLSGTVHGSSIQANAINGDVHVHSGVDEKRLVGLFEELVEVRRQLTDSMRAERGITQVVWVLQAILIKLQDDIVRLTRERDEQFDQAERRRVALGDARDSKRRTERQLVRAELEREKALRLVQLAQFRIRVLEAGADGAVPLSALPQTSPERLRIGLDRIDAYLDAQSARLGQLSVGLDEPRGRTRASVDSPAPAGQDVRFRSSSLTVLPGEVNFDPVRSRVLPSGWLTGTSSTQTSGGAHAVSMSDTSVRVEPLSADDADLLQSVVALGDLHRGRLGLLPYAAFTEAAEQSRLLVALDGEDRFPLGYALYRLPRNEVVLTHLCVREEARNRGVAKALVETITNVHRDRLGVRAKCRDDYGLDLAWRKLGFRPRAWTVGRGADRAPMTVWWKDHGHADLFTEYEQPVELRAAVALDVLRDLADPQPHGHRSGLLVADHLAGRLQLVVTSSMREVTRLTSESERQLIEAIDSYPEVVADRAEVVATRDRILEAVRSRHPHYPGTPQEHDILNHVAHAAAAGLNVFLTWDTDLIAMLGPAVARVTGMVIMSPDHAVVHLDELANAESFLKQEVEGGELDREQADSPLEEELAAFVARHAGEGRDELEERVYRLRNAGHPVELLHLDDGTAVALYAVVPDGEVWRIPLLRLADHRLADTLARHLLWSLRRRARAAGVALLDLSEPHLSRRVVQAADFESMTHAEGHWYAPVVDVCGSSHEVAAAAARSLNLAGLGAPPLLAPGVSAHAAARLEQAWWPAKIIDSELPCFVVPIRTAFAFELFGYPDGMTQGDTQLSLGREHVYYHSSRNSVLTAPARILWLATGKGHGSGHFFGTSKLDGLMVDTPRRLYEALSYYGVFGLKAVIGAANGQPTAEALRLSNTEVFTHPVSVRRYEAMRSRLGDGPSTFFSARRLNPRLFAEIYDTGTRSSANA